MPRQDFPDLDLAEAINLLGLIAFVCENTETAQDFFNMRDQVHSCAFATERLVQAALYKMERTPHTIDGEVNA